VTQKLPRWLTAALTSAALLAAVTAVIGLLEPRVPALGLGVLYLVAVVPIALIFGGPPAAVVSAVSMVTFDFVFLAPRNTLDPGTAEQWGVLGALLVSSLIIGQASAHARREARTAARLAEEQAALRRIATLVADGTRPEEVFPAVIQEVGRLMSVDLASIVRYESDRTITWVASYGKAIEHFPVGSRRRLESSNLGTIVLETGRSVRVDNYANKASGPIGVAAREAGLNSSLATPIMVEGRLWGVIAAGSISDQPVPADAEMRLVGFTELVATAISNAESQAARGRLADEQAALRRVATLVARGAQPAQLFSAVSEEVRQLFDADQSAVGRYEPDGPAIVVVGSAPDDTEGASVGTRWELDDAMATTLVFRTGHAARVDESIRRTASGPVPDRLRRMGMSATVASPIVVEGRLWGAMTVSTRREPIPPDTEERLANFTELVATAIANTESRVALGRLAKQQAALRRVATVVAEGVPPQDVFSVLCEEVNRLFDAQTSSIQRLETDGTVTILANSGAATSALTVGNRVKPLPGWLLTIVLRTGRPARTEDDASSAGRMPGVLRDLGLRSVAAPIIVDGALWGVITVATGGERFPADSEQRLEEFTALAATAIANAESRSEVAASRARIVAASDEARRRIERNLHDGVQQRLVSIGLQLRGAQQLVPPQLEQLQSELSRVAEELTIAFDELREISHGIHPASLSNGGLGPALKALCRRSAVPVELDLHAERRLPERVEVAAYYVVSEALANASKHARASVVHVVAEQRDDALHLSIRDDGLGGAEPAKGSGLTGLRDRVESIGGVIDVASQLGQGTIVVVSLPLRLDHTVAALTSKESSP
jgi:signal transduction histidine kinase